jgi:hypothetical protein
MDGALELVRLDPRDLEREVVEAALAAIACDGYALATRARMVRTLKGFCGFLVRRGYAGLFEVSRHRDECRPTSEQTEPGRSTRLPISNP